MMKKEKNRENRITREIEDLRRIKKEEASNVISAIKLILAIQRFTHTQKSSILKELRENQCFQYLAGEEEAGLERTLQIKLILLQTTSLTFQIDREARTLSRVWKRFYKIICSSNRRQNFLNSLSTSIYTKLILENRKN